MDFRAFSHGIFVSFFVFLTFTSFYSCQSFGPGGSDLGESIRQTASEMINHIGAGFTNNFKPFGPLPTFPTPLLNSIEVIIPGSNSTRIIRKLGFGNQTSDNEISNFLAPHITLLRNSTTAALEQSALQMLNEKDKPTAIFRNSTVQQLNITDFSPDNLTDSMFDSWTLRKLGISNGSVASNVTQTILFQNGTITVNTASSDSENVSHSSNGSFGVPVQESQFEAMESANRREAVNGNRNSTDFQDLPLPSTNFLSLPLNSTSAEVAFDAVDKSAVTVRESTDNGSVSTTTEQALPASSVMGSVAVAFSSLVPEFGTESTITPPETSSTVFPSSKGFTVGSTDSSNLPSSTPRQIIEAGSGRNQNPFVASSAGALTPNSLSLNIGSNIVTTVAPVSSSGVLVSAVNASSLWSGVVEDVTDDINSNSSSAGGTRLDAGNGTQFLSGSEADRNGTAAVDNSIAGDASRSIAAQPFMISTTTKNPIVIVTDQNDPEVAGQTTAVISEASSAPTTLSGLVSTIAQAVYSRTVEPEVTTSLSDASSMRDSTEPIANTTDSNSTNSTNISRVSTTEASSFVETTTRTESATTVTDPTTQEVASRVTDNVFEQATTAVTTQWITTAIVTATELPPSNNESLSENMNTSSSIETALTTPSNFTSSSLTQHNATDLRFSNQLNHLETLNSTNPPEWFLNATATPLVSTSKRVILNLFAAESNSSILSNNSSEASAVVNNGSMSEMNSTNDGIVAVSVTKPTLTFNLTQHNATELKFFNQLNHLEILNSTISPEWFLNATAAPLMNTTKRVIFNLFAAKLNNSVEALTVINNSSTSEKNSADGGSVAASVTPPILPEWSFNATTASPGNSTRREMFNLFETENSSVSNNSVEPLAAANSSSLRAQIASNLTSNINSSGSSEFESVSATLSPTTTALSVMSTTSTLVEASGNESLNQTLLESASVDSSSGNNTQPKATVASLLSLTTSSSLSGENETMVTVTTESLMRNSTRVQAEANTNRLGSSGISVPLHFFNQLNHLEALTATIPPEWWVNATSKPTTTNLVVFNLYPTSLEEANDVLNTTEAEHSLVNSTSNVGATFNLSDNITTSKTSPVTISSPPSATTASLNNASTATASFSRVAVILSPSRLNNATLLTTDGGNSTSEHRTISSINSTSEPAIGIKTSSISSLSPNVSVGAAEDSISSLSAIGAPLDTVGNVSVERTSALNTSMDVAPLRQNSNEPSHTETTTTALTTRNSTLSSHEELQTHYYLTTAVSSSTISTTGTSTISSVIFTNSLSNRTGSATTATRDENGIVSADGRVTLSSALVIDRKIATVRRPQWPRPSQLAYRRPPTNNSAERIDLSTNESDTGSPVTLPLRRPVLSGTNSSNNGSYVNVTSTRPPAIALTIPTERNNSIVVSKISVARSVNVDQSTSTSAASSTVPLTALTTTKPVPSTATRVTSLGLSSSFSASDALNISSTPRNSLPLSPVEIKGNSSLVGVGLVEPPSAARDMEFEWTLPDGLEDDIPQKSLAIPSGTLAIANTSL